MGHLSEVFTDIFLLTAQLRSAREYGDSDALRHRIIDMFESAGQKGKSSGCSEEALRQSRYGLAALLDETIMGSSWSRKGEWSSRTLQYEFFRENIAGVEFFNRLETIRRSPVPDAGLLEVFYLCLVFGFEGQYKLHNREKLKEIVDELAKQIKGSGGQIPSISPHGKRPDELIEVVKGEIPTWVVVVSSVAVIFFFYLVLSFMMSSSANNVFEDLKQLLEGQQ